ncbi:hypothetical protein [Halarchaeum sp. P4]|uniref:hypothetical protein n=1 Tax=Halarchaeum sp. P4 TaxID=3421639 RepID=UPI003EBE84D0
MSSDVVGSVLPDFEPEDEHDEDRIETYRPALATLHQQQMETLRGFLQNGVETRRGLLTWLLRLQYRTLGRLPDYWYFNIATRPSALAVVLTGDERGQYGERDGTDITLKEARSFRRRLVARYLRPACRDAFRELRTRAVEYLDEDNPDPEKMAALAMRPALDEHYQRQEAALEDLLDGFESVDALDEWLHDLDLATFGAIKEVEPEFDFLLLDDAVARRACLRDEPRYVLARERIAARYLLPAFNVAVRTLAEKAGETNLATSEHSGGVEV